MRWIGLMPLICNLSRTVEYSKNMYAKGCSFQLYAVDIPDHWRDDVPLSFKHAIQTGLDNI